MHPIAGARQSAAGSAGPDSAEAGGSQGGDAFADQSLAGAARDAAAAVRADASGAAAPRESCIKHIDAIWFCYSPVYQTTQYYREGTFDSCLGKWGHLWDCMLLRTAAAPSVLVSVALLARREERRNQQGPPPAHIWQMRSPEEASKFWEQEFGGKS
ncbi:unnamed protein product [Closterium sp. Yama58-4]|nr:unnamed protein product [Closterium sp. Yama58-4]